MTIKKRKGVIVDQLYITYYQSDSFDPANPIVFLHGWQSQASVFKDLFPYCQNFIALDLPGFGGSEQPHETWGLAEYTVFLRSFLDKFGVSKPHLVGHSFGGSIIIKYSVLEFKPVPQRIFLIGSAGIRRNTPQKMILRIVSKFMRPLLAVPLFMPIKEKFYKHIGATDYLEAGTMKEIFQKVIIEDLRDVLPKVSQSTTLVWGTDDTDTPLTDGQLMQRKIPRVSLHTINDAGHYAFLDQPEQFKKIFNNTIKQ